MLNRTIRGNPENNHLASISSHYIPWDSSLLHVRLIGYLISDTVYGIRLTGETDIPQESRLSAPRTALGTLFSLTGCSNNNKKNEDVSDEELGLADGQELDVADVTPHARLQTQLYEHAALIMKKKLN